MRELALVLLTVAPTVVVSIDCSAPAGALRRWDSANVCIVMTQAPIPQPTFSPTEPTLKTDELLTDPTQAPSMAECEYETCPRKNTRKIYSVFQPLVDKFSTW